MLALIYYVFLLPYRLYSEYFYFNDYSTPTTEEFHNVVVGNIEEMKKCVKLKSQRACVYEPPRWNQVKVRDDQLIW